MDSWFSPLFPWNSSVSVQFLSHIWLCDPMDCSTPGFPVHHQLLELAQTHVHQVGNAIQPSHPLSSPSLPAFNLPQHQGLFQWVSSSHQMAKVLELQLQHQSFQWKSGLISFRTDWFDLLALQETLKSLLQHRNLKASIIQCSAFFMVHLSHPLGFLGGLDGKESACIAGDLGLIPGLGRFPGRGHGNPFQYSCLENPHEQRSLAGYSPWGHKESDVIERLSLSHIFPKLISFLIW